MSREVFVSIRLKNPIGALNRYAPRRVRSYEGVTICDIANVRIETDMHDSGYEGLFACGPRINALKILANIAEFAGSQDQPECPAYRDSIHAILAR